MHISLPRSPVERLRLLFLLPAVGAALLTIVTLLDDPGTGTGARILVTVAVVALAVHWILGYARGRFSLAAEPLEALAIFAILAVHPGAPVLPLAAILYRSLFGSGRTAAVRAALYVTALLAADARGDWAAETGRALGLTLSGTVLPALHHALRRMERSEQRLRAVLANITDVVAIVDAEGRVRWQSDSAGGVLGQAPETLVGRPFAELVDPCDAERVKACLAALGAEPDGSETLQLRVRGQDGRRDVEAVVVNRLHDPHVGGFLFSMRDTTERRRLEAERAEVQRLRDRVEAQRERQELEAQLRRAERLKSVGLLAGGVAHDFNNLLGVILNSTDFVRDAVEPGSPAWKDVEQIRDAAERGARLTRQLLLFSEHRVIAPETLDLNAVIAGLENLLVRTIGDHVELRHARAEGLWPVEADVSSLEQVLVNLVVNARDAVGSGGTVTVETANVELSAAAAVDLEVPAGRYARLAVRDDGCGMDEDTSRRAFEPFFTTKEVGQGTGLGLATVFGIARAAGGCVRLDSTAGAGTVVEVLLPAAGVPAPAIASAPAPASAPLPAPAPAPAPALRERVLVVEDEASLRTLVERMLTRGGYEVVSAASGREALEAMAREAPFDLLLTDVMMPGMPGPELAALAQERRPGQPVLFMSGYSEEQLARHGARPDQLLPKPFSLEELLAAVRAALGAPSAAQVEAPARAGLAGIAQR